MRCRASGPRLLDALDQRHHKPRASGTDRGVAGIPDSSRPARLCRRQQYHPGGGGAGGPSRLPVMTKRCLQSAFSRLFNCSIHQLLEGNSPIYGYANVCTITGPAAAVAGPTSRGARFCFDPGETNVLPPAPAKLLKTLISRNVGCIDHIVGHEAFNITDDRNGALLDPGQLFGHASLCLALTDGGVHGILPHRRSCPGLRRRSNHVRHRCACVDRCDQGAAAAMTSHTAIRSRTPTSAARAARISYPQSRRDANGGLNTFLSHPEPARGSSTCMPKLE